MRLERGNSRERSRPKKTEIESNSLFRIYKEEDATVVLSCEYQFDYGKWLELGLKENYLFNKQVFSPRGNQDKAEKYLHLIIHEKKSRHENLRLFKVKPFIIRLDHYVTKMKKKILEKESEEIIQEVVEALYYVLKDRFVCSNFRAENFVGVAEQKEKNCPEKETDCPQKLRWKLQSLPFGYKNSENSEIDSPFTWKKEFQPPEAFEGRLTDTEMSESLVWNVGCLWLFILTGNHLLKSKKEINDYLNGQNNDILNDLIKLKALGVEKKSLSSENQKTLMKMLQINPKQRMKKEELFRHPIFGQNIVELRITDNVTDYTTEPSGIIISSVFENNEKYETFRSFLETLLQIINTKEIHILSKEKKAISKINKKISMNVKPNDLSEFSPTRMKKEELLSRLSVSTNKEFEEITFEELHKFIFPYKFCLDKIIFLTRCTKRIKKQLAINMKENRFWNTNEIENENNQSSYEFIYIFEHAMCFMKLVYLQTIQQNLQLFQNVFNIPYCINNIKNTNFDNTDSKWLIFSCTGMYEALSIFFKDKLSQCEAEFLSLLEYGNKDGKISAAGHAKLEEVRDSYKLSSLDSFSPYFYSVIRDVLTKIDTFSCLNEGFKYVLSEMEAKEKKESNRFIENQRLHNKEAYQKYFPHLKKYQQSQTYEYANQSAIIDKSHLTTNSFENEANEQISTMDDIFSLEGEEHFLLKTQSKDITEVEKHVQKLIHKFSY